MFSDDYDVRKKVRLLGVKVFGIIGVFVFGVRKGVFELEDVNGFLNEMIKKGFYFLIKRFEEVIFFFLF